jgi:hypothetical protein
MRVAEAIGKFVVMYYKGKFNRPRASRLYPALMPPIEVPGHASYPSGHATQAYLIAQCLELVMPAQASEAYQPGTSLPIPAKDFKLGPLYRLAERIARNREVLGLHYPSDSAAGRILAKKTFNGLQDTLAKLAVDNNGITSRGFDLLAAAASEWDIPRATMRRRQAQYSKAIGNRRRQKRQKRKRRG